MNTLEQAVEAIDEIVAEYEGTQNTDDVREILEKYAESIIEEYLEVIQEKK